MLKENHHAMLQVLLDLDIDIDVVAALLDIGGFSQEHVRYMAGPAVVHKSPWSETLPKWIFKAVYKDRLEQIFAESSEGVNGKLATPTEVMACMYAATMDAPLGHEWTNVYLWCGNIALTKHGKIPEGQTYWDIVGQEPVTLSEYVRKEYLEKLQRDIRSTVIKVAAERGWKKTQTNPDDSGNDNGSQRNGLKHQPTAEVVQVSLFD